MFRFDPRFPRVTGMVGPLLALLFPAPRPLIPFAVSSPSAAWLLHEVRSAIAV
jgi:hypothetical protein